MTRILVVLCALSFLGLQSVIADDEPGPITPEAVVLDRPVDFDQDVLPIFRAKCLACHSASVKEGQLILESVEAIVKGGDSGPAVVAEKPDESLLFKLASRVEESFMPPVPNDVNAAPLTPRELGVIKLWIQEGAKASSKSGAALQWHSLAATLNPIYSLALSPDETLAAAGRGNRIAVFDVLRQREVATLLDPVLGDVAHRDFVHTLDFSPDGQWLASGGYRIVKLWKKLPTLEAQRPIEGAAALLATSPDGNWIAVARADGAIRLEPSAAGEARTIAPIGAISALTFTPDSSALIAAVGEKISRWNVSDGALAGELTTAARILAVLTTADGAQLFTSHEDGIVRGWATSQFVAPGTDAAQPPAPQVELKGHEKPVTALAWMNADGQKVTSGSEDGTIRLWDAAAGTEVKKIDNGGPVVKLSAAPDGSRVAAVGVDGVVRVWDAAGAKVADLAGDPRQASQIATLKQALTVIQSRKTIAEAAVKETETDIAGREDSLKKANEQLPVAQKALDEAKPKAAEAVQKQKAAEEALAAKADDEALKKAKADADAAAKAAQDAVTKAEEGVASAQRGIELSEKSLAAAKAELEARKQKRDAEIAAEQEATQAVATAETQAKEHPTVLQQAVFTADGSALATADGSGLITLWHVPSKRALVALPAETTVKSIASTPGGRVIAGTEDGRLLTIRTEPQWQLAGHLGPTDEAGVDLPTSLLTGRVLAIDFSPDGSRLAIGSGVPSRSGQLTIWNVPERKLERELPEAHSDTVFDVAFSRDGTLLASGAADKFARVFDVATGALKNTFEGHTNHVLSVAWLADGSRVATGGADNAIKVWNTATNEQTRTITSHQKPVIGLSFVGITENIASAGGDKAVLLHTASNGKNYRRFDGSTDFVHAVVATHDESLVIAGGEDGILRIWNGADGKLITTFAPPAAPKPGDEQASR